MVAIMVRTIAQIDIEINKLKEKLSTTKGTETEVYTRIVGYYRQVGNWNKGKREEYKHRLPFDIKKSLANHPTMV